MELNNCINIKKKCTVKSVRSRADKEVDSKSVDLTQAEVQKHEAKTWSNKKTVRSINQEQAKGVVKEQLKN